MFPSRRFCATQELLNLSSAFLNPFVVNLLKRELQMGSVRAARFSRRMLVWMIVTNVTPEDKQYRDSFKMVEPEVQRQTPETQ
ncbi:hypothetical protein WAI453_012428 [Rhynchosporium graminicola]